MSTSKVNVNANVVAFNDNELSELSDAEMETTTGGFACVGNTGNVIFYGNNANYSSSMLGTFGGICTGGGYKWLLK